MPRWISRRWRNGVVGRGIVAGVLAVAAGLGFWGYGHFAKTAKPAAPPGPQAATQVQAALPPVRQHPDYAPRPPQPRLDSAPIPGPRYVHRGGSVLRDKAKASGHSLKKETKGAKVTLEALESGGWAKVTDGNIHGWMRASVLGVNPPDAN
jgi:hypothetical protein